MAESNCIRKTREEYRRSVREDAVGNFVCVNCGKDSYRRLSGTNKAKGIQNKYCSMACRCEHAAKQRLEKAAPFSKLRECEHCGGLHGGRAKTCSEECRKARACQLSVENYKTRSNRDRSERPCKKCGKKFTPEYGDKRKHYCSKACLKNANYKFRKAKKRAEKYAVAYEHINPIKVFVRDGWRCQMCGKQTPKEYRGSHRSNAPELDHRVPISKGGPHTYSNVQCACRSCNSEKSNKTEAGQMPLFSV